MPPAVMSRAAQREALRQARVAAYMGNHKLASDLFALAGRLYVVEVNTTVRVRDGLDAQVSP